MKSKTNSVMYEEEGEEEGINDVEDEDEEGDGKGDDCHASNAGGGVFGNMVGMSETP